MKRKTSTWFSFTLIFMLFLASSCSKQIPVISLPVLSTSTSTAEPVPLPTLTINPTNTRSPQTETTTREPIPKLVSTVTPITHPRDLQISFFAVSDEMIPIPGYNNTYKNNTSLYLMNLDGSNLVEVLDEAYSDTAEYVWSPDGRQVAYVTLEDYFDTLDTGNPTYSLYDLVSSKLLNLSTVRSPVWHASGKAVIVADSRIWGLPVTLVLMDSSTGATLAELPFEDISENFNNYESFCMAPDGERLAILSGGSANQTAVHLVKAVVEGGESGQPLSGRLELLPPIPFRMPEMPDAYQGDCAWAPDGNRISFRSSWGDGRYSNNVLDLQTGEVIRLTLNVWNSESFASWSSDSQYLAYLESDRHISFIRVFKADGSSNIKIQPDEFNDMGRSFAWTPDGSHLIVTELDSSGRHTLVLYRRDGTWVQTLPQPNGNQFFLIAFRPGSGFTGPWPENLTLP